MRDKFELSTNKNENIPVTNKNDVYTKAEGEKSKEKE